MFPSEEIVSGAVFSLKHIESGQGLVHIPRALSILDKGIASADIDFYHITVFLEFHTTRDFAIP